MQRTACSGHQGQRGRSAPSSGSAREWKLSTCPMRKARKLWENQSQREGKAERSQTIASRTWIQLESEKLPPGTSCEVRYGDRDQVTAGTVTPGSKPLCSKVDDCSHLQSPLTLCLGSSFLLSTRIRRPKVFLSRNRWREARGDPWHLNRRIRTEKGFGRPPQQRKCNGGDSYICKLELEETWLNRNSREETGEVFSYWESCMNPQYGYSQVLTGS